MARVGGASMTHKSSLLIMIFYTITNMCLIILSVYGGIMLNSPTMIVVVFTLSCPFALCILNVIIGMYRHIDLLVFLLKGLVLSVWVVSHYIQGSFLS